jgi:aryl-phospho-beta-D-glucosidase BglC (GH1 family)
MIKKHFSLLWFLILAFLLFPFLTSGSPKEKFPWTKTYGVNVSVNITENDVADLSEWGVGHIRLSFPAEPMMNVEPPYNFNESSFEKLGKILDICEKYNIGVIIDPHKYPGTSHQWTMLGNDEFWTDFEWHEKVIAIWERIASLCANKGKVVAGYALLNEPSIPYNRKENTPSDLNLFYTKLITAIRKIDNKHTIILSAPRLGAAGGNDTDYVDGLEYLHPINDNNLCYEIHMYQPMDFTHQGVFEDSEMVKYPGVIGGENWNIEKIREHLQPANEFATQNNAQIYVGEFSCPRWLGNSGNQYLSDMISVFNEFGFSWAYHAYRESQIWDAERNNFDRNDQSRKKTTPRKELLIGAFKSK